MSLFKIIGEGACGTVLTIPGGHVAKLERDSTTQRIGSLRNDYSMQYKASCAMNDLKSVVESTLDLPRVPDIIDRAWRTDEKWWACHADVKEMADILQADAPCDVVISERIQPLFDWTTGYILDNCCPDELKQGEFDEEIYKDCLVRMHLGAQKPSVPEPPFSFRNYPMYLDQMLDLGMDVEHYTRIMAGGLAAMHWKAQIDAKDVEFVLATEQPRYSNSHRSRNQPTPQNPTTESAHSSEPPLEKRHTHLWVLDFDQCSTITMDNAGVAMAVKAWASNDLYYPKPSQISTVALWDIFVAQYLEVSYMILQKSPSLMTLPTKFICGIAQVTYEKLAIQQSKPE